MQLKVVIWWPWGSKGEVKSYLCRTNEGSTALPYPTYLYSVTAEQNDFFFHYEWCGGGGERRCFAAPRLRRVWERFACLSRRYFDLTWLLHATFLTGIVNSRGITSSGKINSWLTNHYFLTHPHYFPVNSKALIKPSERVNATKARDLFYTRHLFCNLPI